jgi:hypothetical protein
MGTEHSSKHALSMDIRYLVGMDMERSLSLIEPPMPGPPGLLTMRARLMAIQYLVGMDMEHSLSLREPPMPGPPGLLIRWPGSWIYGTWLAWTTLLEPE